MVQVKDELTAWSTKDLVRMRCKLKRDTMLARYSSGEKDLELLLFFEALSNEIRGRKQRALAIVQLNNNKLTPNTIGAKLNHPLEGTMTKFRVTITYHDGKELTANVDAKNQCDAVKIAFPAIAENTQHVSAIAVVAGKNLLMDAKCGEK
jgi:hypothetical protein